MGMSAGGNDGGVMSEINVTPLVDVMLVLLIIFMITAPLLTHKIKVEIPNANPKTETKKANNKPIDLAIKSDGSMYWNDRAVTKAELVAKLKVSASQSPQPELQIRADKALKVGDVKAVLKDAKDAGIVHTAFISTGKK
ncbi:MULTISPECIES: biopolymer transporter ExbD [Oleiagrimonas]|uniref:Biopolymer transporter ExbD n=1 Tax=Oleiagrimonas citrea TaxID=1665687 RepID=A0A846ZQZ0_9GAMM|nr:MULTISPECIES: biopolymer transporter ExbD [Oleiagrimonas]NKZ40077.1 biopolymer transporter ExbD [Oleiagrimonas citrea]RAP57126.1 biopolymer transporter ExbD [Oleiagrimonas sp. MCCC 1A03011]